MFDKDFLQWIHERLIHVHGENKNVDYIMKLRAIIEATDSGKITPNVCSEAISDLTVLNSMAESMDCSVIKNGESSTRDLFNKLNKGE